jgi:hypothetical protein
MLGDAMAGWAGLEIIVATATEPPAPVSHPERPDPPAHAVIIPHVPDERRTSNPALSPAER